MQDEFNYVLVSEDGEGKQFSNVCNEELDFATHPYEVCLQDMIFSAGSWDNVREGANTMDLVYWGKHQIPPGNYRSLPKLVEVINAQLARWKDFYSFKFVITEYIPVKPARYYRSDNAGGYEIKECTALYCR